MSKSRYSKTKAAGAAVGCSVYGKNYGQKSQYIPQENRQMRRARGERGKKG